MAERRGSHFELVAAIALIVLVAVFGVTDYLVLGQYQGLTSFTQQEVSITASELNYTALNSSAKFSPQALESDISFSYGNYLQAIIISSAALLGLYSLMLIEIFGLKKMAVGALKSVLVFCFLLVPIIILTYAIISSSTIFYSVGQINFLANQAGYFANLHNGEGYGVMLNATAALPGLANELGNASTNTLIMFLVAMESLVIVLVEYGLYKLYENWLAR